MRFQLVAQFQLPTKARQNNHHLLNEQQLLDALEVEKNDLRIALPWVWEISLLYGVKPLLASYYSQFKDFVKARNVFRDDTVTAIAILEDDDPDNDSIGYETLVLILPHAGDDQYALSIWSLICPDTSIWSNDGQDDQEEYPIESARDGPIKLSCEGACGKKWTYADNFYVCKSCDRIALCSNCLEKLKRNRLARWNCRHEHSWLHVPPWKDDNAPAKGTIRVLDEAGSPKDMKISYWIKDLKRIWDIE